jgi:4-hydroxy-3-methylbut-2-en-1-yl diphosphate reductase
MKILRADHLGMCFGVRDAIALALETAQSQPLTILGDLVHNETVLAHLRAADIALERDPERIRTHTVMITAHGAADRQVDALRQQGHAVLEATCPLVHAAHRALQDLVRSGYHPVVIGLRDHVEVRGLTGDLQEFDVVITAGEVEGLRERPRFGVVAQTTQPIQRVWLLADLIRQRFPGSEVRVVDTVCRPTKLRQWAAESLSARCDVVIVVGGAHSNNTRELAETCRHQGTRVHQVQNANEIRPDWIRGAQMVGLTAGTSTPDAVIEAVERRLRELAADETPASEPAAALASEPGLGR